MVGHFFPRCARGLYHLIENVGGTILRNLAINFFKKRLLKSIEFGWPFYNIFFALRARDLSYHNPNENDIFKTSNYCMLTRLCIDANLTKMANLILRNYLGMVTNS